MKFSIVAASALFASAQAARQAAVKNDCSTPIYVQSFPFDGGKAGPLTTVQPGKSFTEDQRASGSTVKIATTKTLTNPLFFGYSFSSNPDYAYFTCSQYGNPFANKHNTLSPGAGCQRFDCKAGDANCYSTPSMKRVYGCPQPVTLTAEICKP